jgi:hypothetical protein
MRYLHHSALHNNGMESFSIDGFSWLHHMPSLADFAMGIKARTSKVDAIPVPFSHAQQCVRIGKNCWLEV